MRKSLDRTYVDVYPESYILLAAVILLVPLRWFLGWMISTVVHEACHYLVLRACKIPIYSVSVRTTGMVMETGSMSKKTELISVIAGPMGALLLVLWAKVFPELAICAYIQSAYNLLPVYPLDGGRVLYCFTSAAMTPLWAQRTCIWIERIILGSVILAMFYASICLKLGPLPLIAAGILLFRRQRVKIPCKEGKLRVQ